MIDPVGVPRAQQAALGGIQRAQGRLNQAAADVAHDGVVQNEAARVTFSDEARKLASASGHSPSPLGGERPRHDLPEALVDSMVAEHEMAANVKVLQTTDEVEKTLMDIKK